MHGLLVQKQVPVKTTDRKKIFRSQLWIWETNTEIYVWWESAKSINEKKNKNK